MLPVNILHFFNNIINNKLFRPKEILGHLFELLKDFARPEGLLAIFNYSDSTNEIITFHALFLH